MLLPNADKVLGVIHLKDIVKGGLKDRFDRFRAMGIKTVMITGDNRLTAAAIAAEAGVDDFVAEAKPEDKLALIRREQAAGHLVAMTGDGTNDAPALAQSDVGVAMNTGTQAAKEAGNMVDLDSNPTKLLEIVEIGKQMLITRGALTTFSIANDVAKYFAIIPAMLIGVFPVIAPLNIMGLAVRVKRHFKRRHIQCPYHHRPDSACPAGRAVPARERCGAAAQKSFDLRPRGACRSVCRDKSYRYARQCFPFCLERPDSDMKALMKEFRTAALATAALAVIVCCLYPLCVWGVAQLLFPHQAGGSLLTEEGPLSAQGLSARGLPGRSIFIRGLRQPAPGYDAAASGGSNLGPLSKKLLDAVGQRAAAYRLENGLAPDALVPADAVTASASGLDPHISLENALLQAPRIAKARGMSLEAVEKKIRAHTEGRDLLVLGEPRVNVLLLNMSLSHDR